MRRSMEIVRCALPGTRYFVHVPVAVVCHPMSLSFAVSFAHVTFVRSHRFGGPELLRVRGATRSFTPRVPGRILPATGSGSDARPAGCFGPGTRVPG